MAPVERPCCSDNYKWLTLGSPVAGWEMSIERDVAFGTPVDTCRPSLSTNVGGGEKELEWTCAAHLEILCEFQKVLLLRLDIRVYREIITELKYTYVVLVFGRKLS